MAVHASVLPDDCLYVWFYICISRKICIVRHWKYGEKTIVYTRLVYAYFPLPGRQFVVYALYFALHCASAYISVYSTVFAILARPRPSDGFLAL